MVKLTGPFHSLTASGKLGDVFQVAKYAQRIVAGKQRRPKQPRTRSQLACRIIMGGIAKLWKGLTPAQQASWEKHPEAIDTSAYHAYMSENNHRYQMLPGTRNDIELAHCVPTAAWPATEDTASCFFTNWQITSLSRAIKLKWQVNAIQDNWLATIHYGDDQWDFIRYDNLAGIIAVEYIGAYEIRIEDLPPGDHCLWILPVSHTGFISYRGYYKPVTIFP